MLGVRGPESGFAGLYIPRCAATPPPPCPTTRRSTLGFYPSQTFHRSSSLLLVARHGGSTCQSRGVRPITVLPFVSSNLSTAFGFSSLEDAMLKPSPLLAPNPLGASSSARVEFYDKFQRKTYEYDRDFIRSCDEDLSTTLIFVSAWFFICVRHGIYSVLLGCRPVCSLGWLPLSSSMPSATSNRTFKK